MKKLALILAVALVGASAMAGLAISWASSWGFSDPVLGTGETETLWALVYSTSAIGTFSATSGNDGITDGKSTLKYDGSALTVSGDSTLLASLVSPGTKSFTVKDVISGASCTTTGTADEYMGGVKSDFDGTGLSYGSGGYLYQAVFQLADDGATVSYFVSPAQASADCGDPPVTASMYVEDAGESASQTLIDFQGTYTLSQTQIPEPATLSLLGLGALALAIRRRK